jgi:hypothetical protein
MYTNTDSIIQHIARKKEPKNPLFNIRYGTQEFAIFNYINYINFD